MTAAWVKRLQPASFGGVPFSVDASEREGGRRTVLHEFPFRDDPAIEDLGRRARVFNIECVVIGDDYFDQRDKLVAAFEAPGPQTLVHPYYGKRQVSVGTYRSREDVRAGGAAFFNVSFIDTPATLTPDATVDTQAQLQIAVQGVSDASVASYVAAFNPTALLSTAQGQINGFIKPLQQVAGQLEADAQTVAAAQFAISALAENTGQLLRSPQDLTDAVQAAYANLKTTAVVVSYDFNPGERPAGTSLLVQTEQSNFDALYKMLQQQALVAGGTALLTATFTSYDDALAAREQMTARIDDQQENLTDDSLYLPLQSLRAALVAGVPGPGSDLPEVVTVPLPAGLPSLVLAWKLYGSLDREGDVIARNGIVNPLFVPSGDLQVLSDE